MVNIALASDGEVQNVLWLPGARRPTVWLVDDQRGEFKRAFASTLLGRRVGHGSQKVLAKVAGTSEATYRRWEDPAQPHLPDAWQLKLIAEHLECDAGDLLDPEQLTDRESALARRAARASSRGTRRGLADDAGPS